MQLNGEEGGHLMGGHQYEEHSGGRRVTWYIGVGLFVAWNILLFVLAVVAIAKVNNVHDNNRGSSSSNGYTYAPISRSLVVGAESAVGPEAVVSLDHRGRLRLGGGTSVYMNHGPPIQIPDEHNATDVRMVSFQPSPGQWPFTKDEVILVSYTDAKTNIAYAMLGKVSLAYNAINQWAAPQIVDGLTKAEAVVPLRLKSNSPDPLHGLTFAIVGRGKTFIGHINEQALTMNISIATNYISNLIGISNTRAQLVALAQNQFAISYFMVASGGGTNRMNTTVGTVTYDSQGNYQGLTFATPYSFGAERAFHTIFYLQPNVYGLAYPSVTEAIVNSTTGANDTLVVQRIMYLNSTNSLSAGAPTELNVKPNFFLASASMPAATKAKREQAVIVFIDEAQNNALTAVVVTSPLETGFVPLNTLRFGDMRRFSSGVAGSDTWQSRNGIEVPFVSLCALNHVDLAIAYSDWSNDGRITTFRFGLDKDTALLRKEGTRFVISDANHDATLDYWWVNIVPLGVEFHEGWLVLSYYQSNSNLQKSNWTQTVVDVANPPVGITVPTTNIVEGGKTVPVVLSGVYTLNLGQIKLEAGKYYYTNTRGLLTPRDPDTPATDYVTTADNQLLSLNSRIGLAISDKELLLINEVAEHNLQ